MKKIFAASFCLLLLLTVSTSCKKVIKALFNGLDVDVTEIRITVPANPLAPPLYNGSIDIPTITQSFNLDSAVKKNTNNQFGISDVSSVKVKQITINIVEGANADNNLQNFENVKINFSSNTNTTPVQIASYTFPDTYATSANIATPTSPELRPYLNGSELYYNVSVKPRKVTTNAITVGIRAVVRVE